MRVLLLAGIGLLAAELPAAAQTAGTIRGRVVDAATQRPLSGVQVSVPGSGRGALSDARGSYVLAGVPTGQQIVRANMIGFTPAEQAVTVNAGTSVEVNFELGQRAIEMDALVVTGTPGATQRRAIGNSVTSVNAEQITAAAPINTMTQLLQGRAPGVTVMQGSGQAGTASNYRIRGASSLSAGNSPVFYVDGVRITSTAYTGFGTSNNTRQETSPLDMLNPDDIESIEIIKGPAAATLYGADAAAGVIQVITKKGRAGQQGIEWNAKIERGQSDWHLGMRENYTLCSVSRELAHTSTTINRITNASWPGCHGMDPSAPWQDRLLVETPLASPGVLRTGDISSYNLSARGGGDRYSFFASGARDREEGVFVNNWFNRNSGRANFTVHPLDNLDLMVSTQYSQTSTRQPLNDNASNGWVRNSWRGRPGFNAPYADGWLGLGPEEMAIYNDVSDTERFVIGTTVNYQPRSWFRNRLTAGLDAGDRLNTLFYPIDRTGRAPYGTTFQNGYISNLDRTNRDWTLTYSGTITNDLTRDVSSSFSFGSQYLAEGYRSVQTVGEGLIADVVKLIDVDNNIATRTYENREERRSLGFFVEEQIGWRNRLFLTAGVRMDDHSAFGSNFSRVYYPKVAASWVVSEEPFFGAGVVDNLRLRAAYGHAGNAPNPFAADRIYAAAVAVMDDATLASALTTRAYGNPDLRAERGAELELGLETSLFDSAIGLELNYYNIRTRDALISVPIAPSTGFRGGDDRAGTTLRNIGEIANSGFEAVLFGSPVRSQRLTWDARASISTNQNELISLGGSRDFIPVGYRSSQRHQEGYPLAGYWADVPQYDANGVLQRTSANRPVLAEEMEFVGPSAPTREAALTNSFTVFGNWQLYTFLDYKGGHYLFNMSEQQSINDGNHRLANDPTVSEDEWLVLRYGGNGRFIERADFVKLREVSVRYNIPVSLTQRFGSEGMSLSLAGRNLAVWTGYSGADPEVNIGSAAAFTRGESNSVPMMRRLVATLNVRF